MAKKSFSFGVICINLRSNLQIVSTILNTYLKKDCASSAHCLSTCEMGNSCCCGIGLLRILTSPFETQFRHLISNEACSFCPSH